MPCWKRFKYLIAIPLNRKAPKHSYILEELVEHEKGLLLNQAAYLGRNCKQKEIAITFSDTFDWK